MKVVIVGASGFLGNALAVGFARTGAALLCTARDPAAARAAAQWPQGRTQWIAVDLATVPPAAFWARYLSPGDIVINAAGILREQRAGDFDLLHEHAPVQLFDACAASGVALVVQISALGADAAAESRYHRSKAAADAHLRRCRVASVIAQPSLVWGGEGASAGLFAALAVLPVLALPARGNQLLQPLHANDLVEAVGALAAHERPSTSRTVALVGPEPVSLRDYLHGLRLQLGYRSGAWVLSLPTQLFLRGAAIAGRWPGSFLDAETARMLLRGNTAPPADIGQLLGRAPRSHRAFITPREAETLRQRAWLRWMAPALRLSVAFVWIWTFVVSIGLYPRAQSLELLARVGAQGAFTQQLLLNGAALFDLALGIATLALRAPLRARYLWPLQLALIGFYTLAITLAMPEFWLHPFGPLSKNVPMCVAILLLWALDAPAQQRRRALR